jgi:AcrR family transcriptional regulator
MNEANVRETKDRILDAAERLFALNGIEATSLRKITSDAKVNLAAVNYHFNSKDELVRSVYSRRIRPMNESRIARLQALETNEANTLEAILQAFFEPAVDMALSLQNPGFTIGQMMGRLYTEPHGAMQSLIVTEMGEVARRFALALAGILPHLSHREVCWRLHFTIGMLAHTMAAGEKLKHLSHGLINPHDKQEVLRQMITYAIAGLSAPSPEPTS